MRLSPESGGLQNPSAVNAYTPGNQHGYPKSWCVEVFHHCERCIDMSLLSGAPTLPTMLGRNALGLNPSSCVDGLENVSPF